MTNLFILISIFFLIPTSFLFLYIVVKAIKYILNKHKLDN